MTIQKDDNAVTVVGLGSMGGALARAFLGAGYRTTVWNRTPERAEPLERAGGFARSGRIRSSWADLGLTARRDASGA